MSSASPSAPDLLPFVLRWRGAIAAGFWVLVFAVQAGTNTLVTLIDLRGRGGGFEPWEVATWEVSSNLVGLALIPFVVAAVDRWPLHWGVLRRHLPWHALASVAFCIAHVLGMVALRELAYAARGRDYVFGDWPLQLGYEALKDVRSYALLVVAIVVWRLLLWRWQGEARLLQEPDEPAPATPASAASAASSPSAPAADPGAAAPAPPAAQDRPERFLVKKLGKEFLLPTAEVEWVQAMGNYVNLHRRGHDYPLRATLSGIERQLDPAQFVRVHRSWIVNLAQVEAIEPLDSGDARLRMAAGGSVPCSRTHLDALRARVR
jgi:hypothetical protein